MQAQEKEVVGNMRKKNKDLKNQMSKNNLKKCLKISGQVPEKLQHKRSLCKSKVETIGSKQSWIK